MKQHLCIFYTFLILTTTVFRINTVIHQLITLTSSLEWKNSKDRKGGKNIINLLLKVQTRHHYEKLLFKILNQHIVHKGSVIYASISKTISNAVICLFSTTQKSFQIWKDLIFFTLNYCSVKWQSEWMCMLEIRLIINEKINSNNKECF